MPQGNWRVRVRILLKMSQRTQSGGSIWRRSTSQSYYKDLPNAFIRGESRIFQLAWVHLPFVLYLMEKCVRHVIYVWNLYSRMLGSLFHQSPSSQITTRPADMLTKLSCRHSMHELLLHRVDNHVWHACSQQFREIIWASLHTCMASSGDGMQLCAYDCFLLTLKAMMCVVISMRMPVHKRLAVLHIILLVCYGHRSGIGLKRLSA